MAESVREFFARFFKAMEAMDYDTLESLYHPDYVGVFPQSGERIRGFAQLRKQVEQFPGGPERIPTRLEEGAIEQVSTRPIGAERWAISPGYTVLPLSGPERYTTVARTKYPDGSMWWVVSVVELQDGKIYRSETYFAADFDPPEWRRGMVEIVPRDETVF